MIITGITSEQFRSIVDRVNVNGYQGNLSASIGRQFSHTRFTARVIPLDSGTHWGSGDMTAPGARRSWSGRRMRSACWHAYRDVILGVFQINEHARVSTGMAVYRGLDGFLANYPNTAQQNIGSMMQPAYMPELCDCAHYGISTHESGVPA